MGKTVKILFAVAAINFGIFGLVYFIIGGNAFQGGKIVNGGYYMEDQSLHKKVSRNVYYYSYAHTILSVGLIIAVIGLGFVQEVMMFRKAYSYTAPPGGGEPPEQ